MNAPRLSVCIPTYNRAALLAGALESVLAQAGDEVEVVVSDNASTDDTPAVVAALQARFPRLVYSRSPENLGPDRNYLRSVELASGEYCWLMGSDDALAPGAVARMLNELRAGHDVYLCDRVECDLDLVPRWERVIMRPARAQTWDCADPAQRVAYLDACLGLIGVFSYLSCIVVRRAAWNAAPYDDAFTGSAYSHAYKLLGIVRAGGRVRYVRAALALCRLGNDSFADGGFARRFMLDIDGYVRLADALFADDPASREALLSVLRRERRWVHLPRLRSDVDDPREWRRIRWRLRPAGYNPLALRAAEQVGRFPALLDLLHAARHAAARSAG
jgi:abequosyltransferase